MLSKEQFENIVSDIRKDVHETDIRFGIYNDYSTGNFVVSINKQLYNDLIAFRNTLPIDYYGELELEDYSDDMEILTDGLFYCNRSFDGEYAKFFSIAEWIDGIMPVKIVDNVDYDYKIEFIYSVTKSYKPKEEPIIKCGRCRRIR